MICTSEDALAGKDLPGDDKSTAMKAEQAKLDFIA